MHHRLNPAPYLLSLFCALLIACAGLIPAPETTNQRIAVAQGVTTQLRITGAQLLAAKSISADDAANVLKVTDAAAEGIALARGMAAANPAGADAKLTQIVALLTALQAYLATK